MGDIWRVHGAVCSRTMLARPHQHPERLQCQTDRVKTKGMRFSSLLGGAGPPFVCGKYGSSPVSKPKMCSSTWLESCQALKNEHKPIRPTGACSADPEQHPSLKFAQSYSSLQCKAAEKRSRFTAEVLAPGAIMMTCVGIAAAHTLTNPPPYLRAIIAGACVRGRAPRQPCGTSERVGHSSTTEVHPRVWANSLHQELEKYSCTKDQLCVSRFPSCFPFSCMSKYSLVPSTPAVKM
eukprot:scaffold19754_cov15-Tisochrysis_lutea.AAC.1